MQQRLKVISSKWKYLYLWGVNTITNIWSYVIISEVIQFYLKMAEFMIDLPAKIKNTFSAWWTYYFWGFNRTHLLSSYTLIWQCGRTAYKLLCTGNGRGCQSSEVWKIKQYTIIKRCWIFFLYYRPGSKSTIVPRKCRSCKTRSLTSVLKLKKEM